jgi:hypothetical protein
MRSLLRSVFPTVAALLVALAASSPASGQLATTSFGPFSVSCTPVGELCDNTFSQPISTNTTLRVQYVASAGHCSNVAAHILVDGVERAVTAFLTPGQASGFFDVGPVSPGTHTVALRGEGQVGGCNVGNLANWGGTMDVVHEAAAGASAIPALSAPMLAALVAALLAGASWAIRRRERQPPR